MQLTKLSKFEGKVKYPKITFGIIVLNGEPFTRYCLRSIYPFAHQIIVVEGASPGAESIATKDGHSIDGTLDILKEFKKNEDEDNKLTIITAEDNGYPSGFWPGEKHEQSQAYAKLATGNYLWQVDIDEFYKYRDMIKIIKLLKKDPSISALTFKQISFWGSIDYTVNGWQLMRGAENFHRLFRWQSNFNYVTHRPPTVTNSEGVDLRKINWIQSNYLSSKGIYLYHYCLLFPFQVANKCKYYHNAGWTNRPKAEKWVDDVYTKLKYPYNVHNVYLYPSYLQKYRGEHPEQILKLMQDINSGKIFVHLREVDDIVKLLESKSYCLGRKFIYITGFLHRWYHINRSKINWRIKKVLSIFIKGILSLNTKKSEYFLQ